MRGRKPIPRAATLAATPLEALPRCPAHLSAAARREWRRLATPLHEAGLLTLADRAALAAYCQAYGRWVEAEQKLATTPMLLKAPSGYVQQSPWLAVSNKQMELMGRYMTELGLTPAARSRVPRMEPGTAAEAVTQIRLLAVYRDADGILREEPMYDAREPETPQPGQTITYELDADL
ncbi:phage terminase small subunit P27 family [Meridianimarinicoccus sp. MJW13]|uniref:phage terminase small subunit P27 family n=1 Tax=Meridianimarinicoccus sp. MJW13 TaxID=2720031 RepID=UPI001867AB11|nr:phage terminase small subunit P27 family [Fluviibacterium sp. MJW13]